MIACVYFLVESSMSKHPVLRILFKLHNRTRPFAEGNLILGFGLLGEKKITEQGYGLSFILLSVNLMKPGSVFICFPDVWSR